MYYIILLYNYNFLFKFIIKAILLYIYLINNLFYLIIIYNNINYLIILSKYLRLNTIFKINYNNYYLATF